MIYDDDNDDAEKSSNPFKDQVVNNPHIAVTDSN